MSSATILFCDIAGFSKKSNKLQRAIVESLTAEVAYFIGKYQRKPFRQTEIIALHTGDGVAVAYIHSQDQIWQAESIIQLSFQLHAWADGQREISEPIKLRIGIHTGAIDFVVDINGNTNPCGDSINMAQRIMDAASPSQTLLSDSACRYYFGNDNAPMQLLIDGAPCSITSSKPTETFAKHGVRLLVHSLQIQPAKAWYCDAEPYSKNVLLVSQTPLPKEIGAEFSQRLQNAREIALVQINGDRLLSSLKAGAVQFAEQLERLWVFMPDIDRVDESNYGAIAVGELDIRRMIDQWQQYLSQLAEAHPAADVRLLLMAQPAFYGASYLDWSRPGGRIHISPYIWNTPASDCPGYDLDWIGADMPNVYRAYVRGLDHLCRSGRRLL